MEIKAGVLLVISAVLSQNYVLGFLQELKVYATYQGQTLLHVYHTPQPDITDIGPWVRHCIRGAWGLYKGPNFDWEMTYLNYGEEHCQDDGLNDSWHSVRPLGAEDTSLDALAIYQSHGFFYSGLLVVQPVHGSIDLNAGSLALTGSSSWLVFEGNNFDGTVVCIGPDSSGFSRRIPYLADEYGISKVGSVSKGCTKNLDEDYIESLRREWAAILQNQTLGGPKRNSLPVLTHDLIDSTDSPTIYAGQKP